MSAKAQKSAATEAAERCRLDKWLWAARFFKTRAIAAEKAGGGKIRVNGARVEKAGYGVKIGDVLTFARGKGEKAETFVVEIVAFSEKRVSAPEAQQLYRAVEEATNAFAKGDR